MADLLGVAWAFSATRLLPSPSPPRRHPRSAVVSSQSLHRGCFLALTAPDEMTPALQQVRSEDSLALLSPSQWSWSALPCPSQKQRSKGLRLEKRVDCRVLLQLLDDNSERTEGADDWAFANVTLEFAVGLQWPPRLPSPEKRLYAFAASFNFETRDTFGLPASLPPVHLPAALAESAPEERPRRSSKVVLRRMLMPDEWFRLSPVAKASLSGRSWHNRPSRILCSLASAYALVQPEVAPVRLLQPPLPRALTLQNSSLVRLLEFQETLATQSPTRASATKKSLLRRLASSSEAAPAAMAPLREDDDSGFRRVLDLRLGSLAAREPASRGRRLLSMGARAAPPPPRPASRLVILDTSARAMALYPWRAPQSINKAMQQWRRAAARILQMEGSQPSQTPSSVLALPPPGPPCTSMPEWQPLVTPLMRFVKASRSSKVLMANSFAASTGASKQPPTPWRLLALAAPTPPPSQPSLRRPATQHPLEVALKPVAGALQLLRSRHWLKELANVASAMEGPGPSFRSIRSWVASGEALAAAELTPALTLRARLPGTSSATLVPWTGSLLRQELMTARVNLTKLRPSQRQLTLLPALLDLRSNMSWSNSLVALGATAGSVRSATSIVLFRGGEPRFRGARISEDHDRVDARAAGVLSAPMLTVAAAVLTAVCLVVGHDLLAGAWKWERESAPVAFLEKLSQDPAAELDKEVEDEESMESVARTRSDPDSEPEPEHSAEEAMPYYLYTSMALKDVEERDQEEEDVEEGADLADAEPAEVRPEEERDQEEEEVKEGADAEPAEVRPEEERDQEEENVEEGADLADAEPAEVRPKEERNQEEEDVEEGPDPADAVPAEVRPEEGDEEEEEVEEAADLADMEPAEVRQEEERDEQEEQERVGEISEDKIKVARQEERDYWDDEEEEEVGDDSELEIAEARPEDVDDHEHSVHLDGNDADADDLELTVVDGPDVLVLEEGDALMSERDPDEAEESDKEFSQEESGGSWDSVDNWLLVSELATSRSHSGSWRGL